MKKVRLSGIRKLEIIESGKPKLVNPNDVLLKVLSVGVCGSDIHYFNEGRIGDQVVNFPFTIGHEFSAMVDETAKGVQNVHVGDIIAVDPLLSCGECEQCLKGRENTCLNQRFIGSPGQAEGCLSEYIVVPEKNCFPVPKTMTADQAALIEPLSIGYYASQFVNDSDKDSAIAIFGMGPIGLSVMLSLQSKGFTKISCTDKLDYRLELAKKHGANWTGNPSREGALEFLKREPKFDFVFECCGKQEALDQGVDFLKPGGTLLIVGIPEEMRVSFDINKIRRKEITIRNVRRQNRSIKPCIDLTASMKWSPDFIITHRFFYAQANKAFDTVAKYEDGVIKALIKF